jgi:acetylornithine deacetylase/succinyl-diaminopimelate desuccinylase-like protein
MGSFEHEAEVISRISGAEIEQELIELAKVGGTPVAPTVEQPERFSPSRLALTAADYEGRDRVRAAMEEAGLQIDDRHPLALVATLPGSHRSLEPVTIMSHFDTVPEADMYDGVCGVLAGIKAAKAIKDSSAPHSRDIQILALTGEESSRFKFALFGSKAIFSGLSDAELLAEDDAGIRLMDELDEEDIVAVQIPFYGYDDWQLAPPSAVIELHVEQGRKLEESHTDIGLVESIAAAVRHEVTIGDTAVGPMELLPFREYVELHVAGRADHSGATPMGLEHRADGLLETANILIPVLDNPAMADIVSVQDVEIPRQALNKIPGFTKTKILLNASSEADLVAAKAALRAEVEAANELHAAHPTALGVRPLTLIDVAEPPEGPQLDAAEMRQRFLAAFNFVANVNAAAEAQSHKNVVGTVATFHISPSGQIKLGLDLRGIESKSRDAAMESIKNGTERLSDTARINISPPLPGSGEPVNMDAGLVQAAKEVINDHSIGSFDTMFSAAGHDAQNAARAGIPAVMLFAPSREGIAHNPDAYTSPDHLERAAKALAALALRLAQ